MINERKTVNQNKEQQEYVFSILTYRSAAKSSNLAAMAARSADILIKVLSSRPSRPYATLQNIRNYNRPFFCDKHRYYKIIIIIIIIIIIYKHFSNSNYGYLRG